MAKKNKVFYSVDFFAKLHAGEVDSFGNEIKKVKEVKEVKNVEANALVEDLDFLAKIHATKNETDTVVEEVEKVQADVVVEDITTDAAIEEVTTETETVVEEVEAPKIVIKQKAKKGRPKSKKA